MHVWLIPLKKKKKRKAQFDLETCDLFGFNF